MMTTNMLKFVAPVVALRSRRAFKQGGEQGKQEQFSGPAALEQKALVAAAASPCRRTSSTRQAASMIMCFLKKQGRTSGFEMASRSLVACSIFLTRGIYEQEFNNLLGEECGFGCSDDTDYSAIMYGEQVEVVPEQVMPKTNAVCDEDDKLVDLGS